MVKRWTGQEERQEVLLSTTIFVLVSWRTQPSSHYVKTSNSRGQCDHYIQLTYYLHLMQKFRIYGVLLTRIPDVEFRLGQL